MPSKYILKTNRKVRSGPDVLERAARKVSEEGISYEVLLVISVLTKSH